jgi:hypothetical protein
MTNEINKFESRFDVLQDQFAALRLDVQKTIASMKESFEVEKETEEDE